MKFIVEGRTPKLSKSKDVVKQVYRANMMTELYKPQSLKSPKDLPSLERFRYESLPFLIIKFIVVDNPIAYSVLPS